MLDNDDHEKYCWKLKIVTFAICVIMPGETFQKTYHLWELVSVEKVTAIKKWLQTKSYCSI